MRSKTQRSVGRHRKTTTSQSVKGRVALVTVAAGAVSSAGMGGAAAAQMQAGADTNTKTQSVDFELAANSNPLQDASQAADAAVSDASATAEQAAPQILAIAENKPVENLSEQLSKAVEASQARVAADLAARAPSISRPAEGTLTSPFAMRWGVMHSGIDIANTNGTPILAVMDGTVIDSGPASGYGQWIRIMHDDGTMTIYGHMDTLDVAVGQRVVAGQKIAGMGSQGFSTGTHLHFEVHPGAGAAIDPLPWLEERGIHI